MSKIGIYILITYCLSGTVGLIAENTGVLVDEGYGAFRQGEFEQLSLSTTGELERAPALRKVVDLEEPVVWAAITDGEGRLILGTGNAGKVVRVDSEGTVETLFESDAVLTRGLAVDEAGNIYVGTSPNGAIYRLPAAGGRAEVFWDGPETYLWDFEIRDGSLWVVTGMPAKLIRLRFDESSPMEAEVWFEAKDTHFVDLYWDEDRWLIGSAPNGILYSVKSAEEAKALVKVGDTEIRQIGGRSGDAIYFTSYSNAERSKGTSMVDEKGNETMASEGSCYFYRLEDSGYVEAEWRSTQSGIFSLRRFGENFWLAGMNEDGNIYYLNGRNDWGFLQQLPKGGEVSAILEDPEVAGAYLVISSNPGGIWRLGGSSDEDGAYESRILDARQVVQWGAVELNTTGKGMVDVSTRTGNTDEPDATWSSWTLAEEGQVGSPMSRFIQYKFELKPENADAVLRARIFYQMENKRPTVTGIDFLDFGVDLEASRQTVSSIDFSALQSKGAPDGFLNERGTERLKVNRLTTPGLRTVYWKASDPNGDELKFDVELQSVDRGGSVILARGLTDPVYVFNTLGLATGRYRIRVVADDGLSNLGAERKTDEAMSRLFIVDTTPPEVELETIEGGIMTLRVDSTGSRVVAAQISIDGAEAIRVRPIDGIFDREVERFRIEVGALKPGQGIVFEVLDESKNQTIFTHQW